MENRNYVQQIQNQQVQNVDDGRRMELAALAVAGQIHHHSQQQPARRCPRCQSENTKFCYFNNYSLSQPRYFCKGCRRYWTHGGILRNIPVGGASRKAKRPRIPTAPSSTASVPQPPPLPAAGSAASVFAPAVAVATQFPAHGGVGFYNLMNLQPPVGPNVGFLQGGDFGRDLPAWQQSFIAGGGNGNAAPPAQFWTLGGGGASSSGGEQGCGRGGGPTLCPNDWPDFPAAGGDGADE